MVVTVTCYALRTVKRTDAINTMEPALHVSLVSQDCFVQQVRLCIISRYESLSGILNNWIVSDVTMHTFLKYGILFLQYFP